MWGKGEIAEWRTTLPPSTTMYCCVEYSTAYHDNGNTLITLSALCSRLSHLVGDFVYLDPVALIID